MRPGQRYAIPPVEPRSIHGAVRLAPDDEDPPPPPDVVVRELADSGVRMQARVWLRDPDRSGFVNVRSQLVKRIKQRFETEAVTIPFPQRTISERT